jgi:glycosyltransferase involved in cell wall biosynthesis
MAQYAWELMTALARHPRAGYRFELVSGEDLEQQFQSDLYPIHAILPTLRHRSTYATRASWALSRVLHYRQRERRFLSWLATRPDIVAVHLQEWTPWLAGSFIRRIHRMGKKVFFTVHNVVPHKLPMLVPKAAMERWVRRASSLCDGLIVHTDPLAERLSQFLGDPHPPIYVMPHGVWTVRDSLPQPPSMADRLALRRLLFFGTIRRNKGLDVLLRAAQELPEFSITIAGEPDEPDYFRNEILPEVQRLQRAGIRIDLRDEFVADDDLPALFASHSAIVMPYTSSFVAQSGVVFLALAYEIPVVASEAGGLADLLAEYRIGQTFRDATPGALAAAVRALHSGAAPQELMSQIRAAKRRHSWGEAAEALIAAYSSVHETVLEANDCSVHTTFAS